MTDTPRTDAAAWQDIESVALVTADFARELERELAQRTAERDEARRDACVSEARYQEERNCPLNIPLEHWIQGDAKHIAAERGWDCFDAKEGSGA
jgi:isocitrate dehydrogenase kinase/phosphatase